MRKVQKIALAVALASSCTCALASSVKVRHSDFDNSTEVSIKPYGINCGFTLTGLAIGATWSSAWGEDAILDIESVNHFASMTGAALSIDGQITELKMEGLTDHQYTGVTQFAMPESSGRFVTNLATIRAIVAAQTSMLRLNTSKGYEECYIRKDGKPLGTKGYGALQQFIEAVDARHQAAQNTP